MSLKEGEWKWFKVPDDDENRPKGLYRSACVLWKDEVFIFGGQKNATESTADLVSYHMKKGDWETITPRGTLTCPPLDSHTMNLWTNAQDEVKIVIFGGFLGGSAGKYSNDLYTFDLSQRLWSCCTDDLKEEGLPATKRRKGKSKRPAERAGHASTIYKDYLFVFGGFNDEVGKMNDLWVVDLTKPSEWHLIEGSGTPPDVN